jgi:hypothetical protein
MKFISQIKEFLKNVKAPRYSVIYRKSDGTTDVYVLQNPSIFKGNKFVTYSNDHFRKAFGYERTKGFRALVIGKGVRSFDWDGIKNITKLSPFEVVA